MSTAGRSGFRSPRAVAAALDPAPPGDPAPAAVAYRVGPPAAQGGRLMAVWHQPLAPGRPLPAMPLPLGPEAAVGVDLDGTYARAAADSYIE